MIVLFFLTCFEDVHKNPIYCPDKCPSDFETVLAEQSCYESSVEGVTSFLFYKKK